MFSVINLLQPILRTVALIIQVSSVWPVLLLFVECFFTGLLEEPSDAFEETRGCQSQWDGLRDADSIVMIIAGGGLLRSSDFPRAAVDR
jgi:hypothetical protein